MKSGEQTGEFGYCLNSFLKAESSEYIVYYDHGDSNLDNVGVIQGFVGTQPKGVNTLAEVDVMVVDAEGNIKLLIEIEDKSSPSPKKLLGVLFSIILLITYSNFTTRPFTLLYFSIETCFLVVLLNITRNMNNCNKIIVINKYITVIFLYHLHY